MTATTEPLQIAGTAVERDSRWRAVVERDRAFNGVFVYSVATTGVYCRPSCPSRHARPENVRFHPTSNDAEREGFRPCKRCRPDQPSLTERHAETIAAVCRVFETAENIPCLTDLARQAGLSPYHLHRVFKAVTGITPKVYAATPNPSSASFRITFPARIWSAGTKGSKPWLPGSSD